MLTGCTNPPHTTSIPIKPTDSDSGSIKDSSAQTICTEHSLMAI